MTIETQEKPAPSVNVSAERLKSLIERVENLEEERKGLADDVKDLFTEASSAGFDVKAMKAVIKLRKISREERQEQEAILETYMSALGMA